jgi:5-methylcytosine-specific restriction endonuclease McrA
MTALKQISEGLRDNRLSGREKVQIERKCRLCPERRTLTRHHLVPLSWFLSVQGARFRSIRNANSNIVPLCASCHRIVDGVHDPVGRLQKRAALRSALGTNEVSFVLQVRGEVWFDEEYSRHP